MRDKIPPFSESEQLNRLSDELCGYREASFYDMMDAVKTLKTSDAILRVSQNAMSRRKDIMDAVDQLMAEIEGLSEDI